MKVIIATFDDATSARHAAERLRAAGFDRVDILDRPQELTGYGLPVEAIDRHRADLSANRILVACRCDAGREMECHQILEGGIQQQGTGQQIAGQQIGGQQVTGQQKVGQETIRVPIVEEQVSVGKVSEQRGGVRLHTYVEELEVSKTVQLREEHVEVERHKVDRPVNAGDRAVFEERTIKVDEMAERPVVKKEARVVEEIEIKKDVSTRPQTVTETVRRTDVEIDEDIDVKPLAADAAWRHHFDTNYASSGESWDTWHPAYKFGHELGSDERYRNAEWGTVESEARTRWGKTNDISTWEKIKAAVRHAFDGRKAESRRASL